MGDKILHTEREVFTRSETNGKITGKRGERFKMEEIKDKLIKKYKRIHKENLKYEEELIMSVRYKIQIKMRTTWSIRRHNKVL